MNGVLNTHWRVPQSLFRSLSHLMSPCAASHIAVMYMNSPTRTMDLGAKWSAVQPPVPAGVCHGVAPSGSGVG